MSPLEKICNKDSNVIVVSIEEINPGIEKRYRKMVLINYQKQHPIKGFF